MLDPIAHCPRLALGRSDVEFTKGRTTPNTLVDEPCGVEWKACKKSTCANDIVAAAILLIAC